MDQNEVITKIEDIIEEAKAALLTTSDADSKPHVRWMTPVLLRSRDCRVYCFAVRTSAKIDQIAVNPNAEWLFQSRDLGELVNARGIICALDNPSLKSEMLEILGPRLNVFWRANVNSEDFLVLETKILSASYNRPMKQIKETIDFTGAA